MIRQTDQEYMRLALKAAEFATCKKISLGCILVTDSTKLIFSGSNGPAKGLPLCDPCPRAGYVSGLGRERCRAVHAERRAILNAARMGFSTKNATLFSAMGVPCKDCMLELIEAGVREIVCERETYYDTLSKTILKEWVATGGIFRIVTPEGPRDPVFDLLSPPIQEEISRRWHQLMFMGRLRKKPPFKPLYQDWCEELRQHREMNRTWQNVNQDQDLGKFLAWADDFPGNTFEPGT